MGRRNEEMNHEACFDCRDPETAWEKSPGLVCPRQLDAGGESLPAAHRTRVRSSSGNSRPGETRQESYSSDRSD